MKTRFPSRTHVSQKPMTTKPKALSSPNGKNTQVAFPVYLVRLLAMVIRADQTRTHSIQVAHEHYTSPKGSLEVVISGRKQSTAHRQALFIP